MAPRTECGFSSEKWIGTSERPVSQLNTQPVTPQNPLLAATNYRESGLVL